MSETIVHSLVYTCMAREKMHEVDIQSILDVSRRNNPARGITGILFFRDGQFLQVLEGREDQVLNLVETIMCDSRQKGLAVLDQFKGSRLFGEWAMHYRSLDVQRAAGSNLSQFVSLPPELDVAPLRLRKLLVSFMNR